MEQYKKKLIKGSVITAIGTAMSSLINIFIYFLLIRMFSFSEYGIYASLFAITSYFTFIAPGLNLYFAKLGSLLKNNYDKKEILILIRNYSLRIVAVLFAISIGYLLFPSLHFRYAWFVVGLGLIALLQPILTGFLQGLQKFSYLSILTVMSTSLKAIAIACVVFYSFSLQNILLAVLISIFMVYMLHVLLVKKIYEQAGKGKHIIASQTALPNLFKLIIITLLLNSFINADILLVKYFLSSTQVGIYASEMALAKSILLITGILGPIMYSLTSETAIKGEKGSGISNQTMLITFLLGCGAIIFLKFFSQIIFTSLFNKQISPTDNYVWIMAIAITLYGLSDIMIHYLLSQNRTHILIPLGILAVLQILLIVLYHNSIFQISMDILIIFSLLFIVSWQFYRRAR